MGPYQAPMYQGYNYPQYGMTTQQRLAQMEQQYPQFAQPAAMPAPAQNVTWIPVSGLQGAKDHIVQPNTTAWLMDNNDTVFYVKSSDNLGVTTLKAYRFQEIGLDAPQATAPVIDPSQYVQRGEFEDLKAQMDKLISAMQKQPAKANKEAQNG